MNDARPSQTTCPRCQHRAHVRRRSPLWWVALVAATLTFVVMILAAGLIGPFIVGVVPVLAVVGFAFGPLHAILREEPTCERCGRGLGDVMGAAAAGGAERPSRHVPSPARSC